MRRLGILTGGGDVPGLNVVIKTACTRAFGEGADVLGLRKGWEGIACIRPEDPNSVTRYTMPLDAERVRRILLQIAPDCSHAATTIPRRSVVGVFRNHGLEDPIGVGKHRVGLDGSPEPPQRHRLVLVRVPTSGLQPRVVGIEREHMIEQA